MKRVSTLLMRQKTKGNARKQRTVPNLDYVHTFPIRFLIPRFIYRITSKDCDKARCYSVGNNDGGNDPCGYPEVSTRKYSQIEREYGQLRQASGDLVDYLGCEEPLCRSALFQINNTEATSDSLALKASILCR